jgi:hypothetical protein
MITYLAEKETVFAKSFGFVSLVRVRGDKFPLNRGNYFSLVVNGKNYEICNFWYEDLEHLVKTGVVPFPIKIKILDERWAMVYDERVPADFYSETSYRAPQKYWSLKQLMERQQKLDSGEIEIIPYKDGSGYCERIHVKPKAHKLIGNWTVEVLQPLTVATDLLVDDAELKAIDELKK